MTQDVNKFVYDHHQYRYNDLNVYEDCGEKMIGLLRCEFCG